MLNKEACGRREGHEGWCVIMKQLNDPPVGTAIDDVTIMSGGWLLSGDGHQRIDNQKMVMGGVVIKDYQ